MNDINVLNHLTVILCLNQTDRWHNQCKQQKTIRNYKIDWLKQNKKLELEDMNLVQILKFESHKWETEKFIRLKELAEELYQQLILRIEYHIKIGQMNKIFNYKHNTMKNPFNYPIQNFKEVTLQPFREYDMHLDLFRKY